MKYTDIIPFLHINSNKPIHITVYMSGNKYYYRMAYCKGKMSIDKIILIRMLEGRHIDYRRIG